MYADADNSLLSKSNERDVKLVEPVKNSLITSIKIALGGNGLPVPDPESN